MASLATACRASARLVGHRVATRALTTSSKCLAAQNFIMPALSPTMTEGNIANWAVKEGQSFSAGDVLLEIETDKATMDVEAQEDGVVFKILENNGAKGVQVGARIAVLAEPGDNLATLEMPAGEPQQQQQQASKSKDQPAASSESPAAEQARDEAARQPDGETHTHKHPLMPSVEFLVHKHHLSTDDLAHIKPTGPGGRLLKGDVLAYLGTIAATSPAAVSGRFERLSHLDLSNVKVAAPAPKPQQQQQEASKPAAVSPPPTTQQLSMPVSLANVVHVQKKIHRTLGVMLPLSTFVSRAADVANEDLPRAAAPPTPAQLFDQILGLDKVKAATSSSRGIYTPQISVVLPPSLVTKPAPQARRAHSLFDELVVPRNKPAPRSAGPKLMPGLSSGDNVFSLVVPKHEVKRGTLFLERCKAILEEEPGRLVL